MLIHARGAVRWHGRLAVGMAADDFGDYVGQIGLRFDAVELGGFDKRGDGRPMLTATVGPREERVLAIQCNGANGALHDIGVDLDAPVIDEAGEPQPARTRSGSLRQASSSG